MLRTIASSTAVFATLLAMPASAQIGGFGTSTAGGSGGTPTGPTNFTGIYGQSSSGGSGGFSTGPTEFSTSGFGLSTGAGSGGRASGPTNPALPQFGGSAPTGIGGRPPALGGGILGVPNIMVPEASALTPTHTTPRSVFIAWPTQVKNSQHQRRAIER
jgi:hypothetical protein